MNKLKQLKYLNKGEFNPNKHCSYCGCNGSTRKHTYYFSYNRKAKICVFCEQKFDNPYKIVEWLEKNAIYSKSGKLINFKKEMKKND